MIKTISSSFTSLILVIVLSFCLALPKAQASTSSKTTIEASPEVNLETQTEAIQDTTHTIVQDSTSQAELKESLFDYLALPSPTNPNVVMVYQSEAIKQLIERSSKTSGRGYRIQIYSSNSGDHARWEALKIEKELKETLPNIDIYTTYTAPFWKVRIGNCNNRDEAQLLRTFIMEKFPDYRTQTYIVPSNIEK